MTYENPYSLKSLLYGKQSNIIINNQLAPKEEKIKWTIYQRIIICPFCSKKFQQKFKKNLILLHVVYGLHVYYACLVFYEHLEEIILVIVIVAVAKMKKMKIQMK